MTIFVVVVMMLVLQTAPRGVEAYLVSRVSQAPTGYSRALVGLKRVAPCLVCELLGALQTDPGGIEAAGSAR